MPEPTSLWDILSEAGLPATAALLAWGLVKGADALESDAKEDRLKYISGLIKDTSFTSSGKLGASVVPFVFDEVFGSRVFSFRFIFRSILASIMFWVILCVLRRANFISVITANAPTSYLYYYIIVYLFTVFGLLFVDWLSLVKAKYILGVISQTSGLLGIVAFVTIDLIATILLPISVLVLLALSSVLIYYYVLGYSDPDSDSYVSNILNTDDWHSLSIIGLVSALIICFAHGTVDNIVDYFSGNPIQVLGQIAIPSTMLTSAWVVLCLASILLVKLLTPLDYLRGFTLWWFKDIDAHPLRAIAKVAAALIVVGAFVLKAVRWGWMMV